MLGRDPQTRDSLPELGASHGNGREINPVGEEVRSAAKDRSLVDECPNAPRRINQLDLDKPWLGFSTNPPNRGAIERRQGRVIGLRH
jgi:hypothetical protein